MPPFPKPRFQFSYDLPAELAALRKWEREKEGRDVPARAANRLLIATWNVANLGVQQRRESDYRLIAEIVGWFDVVALQEVNDNLAGLRGILDHLPKAYHLLFSDVAGNNERMAFAYDSRKVTPLEKVGEIGIPPKDLAKIKLPGVRGKFSGFDRNPYLAAFEAGKLRFMLVNVHLYFGKKGHLPSTDRRCLETFAVARWADQRRRSKNSYCRDVIALGDFNLPKVEKDDPVFKALTRKGLRLPEHTTRIGSTITADAHYDQIAFFPAETNGDFTGRTGVFDFDGALFKDLWARVDAARGAKAKRSRRNDFMAYMRYYLSDHRPMWAEFKI
jgi:endonuclease/exonuclease/phosphatase family metal-dependent hydrolase